MENLNGNVDRKSSIDTFNNKEIKSNNNNKLDDIRIKNKPLYTPVKIDSQKKKPNIPKSANKVRDLEHTPNNINNYSHNKIHKSASGDIKIFNFNEGYNSKQYIPEK